MLRLELVYNREWKSLYETPPDGAGEQAASGRSNHIFKRAFGAATRAVVPLIVSNEAANQDRAKRPSSARASH